MISVETEDVVTTAVGAPIEAPEPQEGENADKNQEEKEIKKEEQ